MQMFRRTWKESAAMQVISVLLVIHLSLHKVTDTCPSEIPHHTSLYFSSYQKSQLRSRWNLLSWYVPTRRLLLPLHFPFPAPVLQHYRYSVVMLSMIVWISLFYCLCGQSGSGAVLQSPGPPSEAPEGDTCRLKPSAARHTQFTVVPYSF